MVNTSKLATKGFYADRLGIATYGYRSEVLTRQIYERLGKDYYPGKSGSAERSDHTKIVRDIFDSWIGYQATEKEIGINYPPYPAFYQDKDKIWWRKITGTIDNSKFLRQNMNRWETPEEQGFTGRNTPQGKIITENTTNYSKGNKLIPPNGVQGKTVINVQYEKAPASFAGYYQSSTWKRLKEDGHLK